MVVVLLLVLVLVVVLVSSPVPPKLFPLKSSALDAKSSSGPPARAAELDQAPERAKRRTRGRSRFNFCLQIYNTKSSGRATYQSNQPGYQSLSSPTLKITGSVTLLVSYNS